jgi:hypothetical protein
MAAAAAHRGQRAASDTRVAPSARESMDGTSGGCSGADYFPPKKPYLAFARNDAAATRVMRTDIG